MNAHELLQAGDFAGALAALQSQVKAAPADPRLRVFLFQMLCVSGDWKRAVTQLKLCAELDPEAENMARTYREAIACEVFRERVFAGAKEPLVFGQPQEWVALLIQALQALARGEAAAAADLRGRAFEAAEATPGEVISGENDPAPFDWVADADMRLGPVLEVVVNGRYFWMPFNVIATLRLDPPEDLRDAVWMPANLTLRNGGEFVALIPTRYAGTTERGTDAQKLSRATSWEDAGAETWVGLGQRLLTTQDGDIAVMDLRSLQFGDG